MSDDELSDSVVWVPAGVPGAFVVSLGLTTLIEVAQEIERAREKHGSEFVGAIADRKSNLNVLEEARFAGKWARECCDQPHIVTGPFDVLMEEVGELADDIINGRDIQAELTQVVAVSLAWLEAIS